MSGSSLLSKTENPSSAACQSNRPLKQLRYCYRVAVISRVVDGDDPDQVASCRERDPFIRSLKCCLGVLHRCRALNDSSSAEVVVIGMMINVNQSW
jgi:hypothetical protein